MNKILFFAVSCLVLGANPAAANAVFCSRILQVSASGGLAGMADSLIENGTCMASREAVDAIAKGDKAADRLCVEATQVMSKEFLRRFPNRNPSLTIGRC